MIKYECEECGAVVVTEEAIGSDVYLDNVKGKAFQWQGPDGEVLTITYEDTRGGTQQFCYGCMFRSIGALLNERFPARMLQVEPDSEDGVDVSTDTSGESKDQVLSQLYSSGELSEPDTDSTSNETIGRVKPTGTIEFCRCLRGSPGTIVEYHPDCPIHRFR